MKEIYMKYISTGLDSRCKLGLFIRSEVKDVFLQQKTEKSSKYGIVYNFG